MINDALLTYDAQLWKKQVMDNLLKMSDEDLISLWSSIRWVESMLAGSGKTADWWWYWFSREVLLAYYRRNLPEIDETSNE